MQDENESLLKFPCEFAVKAMGRQEADFHTTVVSLVRRHVPEIPDAAVKARPSKNGNYQSITITFQAQSRAQLDAIYQDLHACDKVLMAL